jgi:hypothetical protein
LNKQARILIALRSLLAAALAACATTAPASWQDGDARGDFDGDGRRDIALFEETPDGALVVIVRRAAAPNEPLSVWGGDISSAPYFTLSAAPPGTYRTNCEAYGGCSGATPEQVALSHDGLIVRGVDDGSRTLYYWDGATFQNVSIIE